MSLFNVDPVRGPELASAAAARETAAATPASSATSGAPLSATRGALSGLDGETAQTFAAILQMQMDNVMLGGLGGGLGGGGSSFGGGGFGGGGGSGLDSSLQSLLLMQTIAPLTQAINALSAKIEALESAGADGEARYAGAVTPVDAPRTLPFRDLIEGLAERFQVPAAFLGAVMMAESGGDPNAVGDNGASVGLFQLHDQGMGESLGSLRLDPELNASIGARGLADGWHAGLDEGLSGEELVRYAYDYRFNPGGGFGWQGDAVYSYYRFYENLAQRDEALPQAGVIAASAPAGDPTAAGAAGAETGGDEAAV